MPQDNNLHKAANKGDLDECKKWVEEPPEGEDKIDVNELGANDRTPMHRAAGGGFLEICEYLHAMGGDISKPDKSGRTPLHWAAIAGFVECMEFLLAKGAAIDAETKSQMNVLHAGCAANSDGKLPYQLAEAAKNKEIIKVLQAGGDKHAASSSCTIM
jgi:ankyrin repeat protein